MSADLAVAPQGNKGLALLGSFFGGLKTSAAILVGIALGLAVALPLAWTISRRGADTLAHNVGHAIAVVEARQQAMADQALQLQALLASKGARRDADIFRTIQSERGRLAGEADLKDKLGRIQRLEEALLRSEVLWRQSGAALPSMAASHNYQDHGRVWDKQKRLLVREQKAVEQAVAELNSLLARWPARWLLQTSSIGGFITSVINNTIENLKFLVRWCLDWVGYGARKTAALRGQEKPPEPPKWKRPDAIVTGAYMLPMHPPIFLADAPLPDDSYNEVQFTQQVADEHADVELGEDAPQLENRSAPEGYQPVLPQPQKTVDYRTPR